MPSDQVGKRRDVFLSHGSADKSIAEEICRGFESAGLTCWIAPRDIDPGASWAGSIMEAIADCRVMVLIFSARSNASEHVQREILHAVEKKYPVLPIRVENVVPTGGLAYCLLGLQWYDAFAPPLDQHIAALVARVRGLLGRPQSAPMPDASDGSSRGPQSGAVDPARDIYFHCEKCGQSLVTDSASAGQCGECPACRNPFTVPAPGPGSEKLKVTAASLTSSPQTIPSPEIEKIESCFTSVMGPIGPKIVRKAIASGTTRVALRNELLEAIPVARDREDFLRCCGNLLPAGLDQAVAAPKTSPLAPPVPAAPLALTFDSAKIAELKVMLAGFLGPMAKVLVDRALPKAANAAELIHRLAGELDEGEDRDRFTETARRLLLERGAS
jgi:hypothetical protein